MIEAKQKNKEEAELPIGFVALFFGKTVSWLRWCEGQGYFTYPDGSLIVPQRGKKDLIESTLQHRRSYTYQNIIDMADSLLRLNKITNYEHNRIITRVSVMQN